jgi:hypothetical protein
MPSTPFDSFEFLIIIGTLFADDESYLPNVSLTATAPDPMNRLWDPGRERASRSRLFKTTRRIVFDKVGDRQIGVHSTRVDDAMDFVILKEYVTSRNGTLLAVRIVKVNTA